MIRRLLPMSLLLATALDAGAANKPTHAAGNFTLDAIGRTGARAFLANSDQPSADAADGSEVGIAFRLYAADAIADGMSRYRQIGACVSDTVFLRAGDTVSYDLGPSLARCDFDSSEPVARIDAVATERRDRRRGGARLQFQVNLVDWTTGEVLVVIPESPPR